MPDITDSIGDEPVEPSPNVAAKLIDVSKKGLNGETGGHVSHSLEDPKQGL